jgi:hypothetical protein
MASVVTERTHIARWGLVRDPRPGQSQPSAPTGGTSRRTEASPRQAGQNLPISIVTLWPCHQLRTSRQLHSNIRRTNVIHWTTI